MAPDRFGEDFQWGDPEQARAAITRRLGRPMNKREERLFAKTWTIDDADADVFAASFIHWQLGK